MMCGVQILCYTWPSASVAVRPRNEVLGRFRVAVLQAVVVGLGSHRERKGERGGEGERDRKRDASSHGAQTGSCAPRAPARVSSLTKVGRAISNTHAFRICNLRDAESHPT